ncbi:hypothetical protein OEA41_002795 [Lepraria neglecta]|uniref:Uncharacterized protein n=1 Tax=Lepraria neglecta TaxID=209136 RepID=A0AAE0DKZ1_9LECA|nr:hypothetical protein OEA41_002795 [Lepraria neglecta]
MSIHSHDRCTCGSAIPSCLHETPPIAEAAAKAGFDCSNWGKLKRLIDTVRAVNGAVSYPDRWTGPAAFQGSIYPDRWSAESTRLRKGVVRGYQDTDRAVSVPAFVVTASQILRNMNGPPRVRGTPAVSFAAGTGSNRMPLGLRSNKRTGDELIDLGSSSPKRAKTEAPSTPAISGSSQSNCIDLTQDDKPVTYVPTRRQPTRPALANISNNATGGNRTSKKQVVRRQRVTHERMVHRETTRVLAKIANKLRASAHALDVDRETLRARWEVDNNLQLQHIADHLAELNE